MGVYVRLYLYACVDVCVLSVCMLVNAVGVCVVCVWVCYVMCTCVCLFGGVYVWLCVVD